MLDLAFVTVAVVSALIVLAFVGFVLFMFMSAIWFFVKSLLTGP